MVSAGRAGDSAPEWLLPWFLFYLPTCNLITCHPTYVPFRHQLQSPENYPTAHKISVYCACKKRIRRILLTSHRTSKHWSWGWIWGRQGRRPVGSRWEEVLYTARLKYLVHVRIMCRLKDTQIWVMLKTNLYKNKVASFAFQITLLYNYSAEVCVEFSVGFNNVRF